jgi:RNA polymerase sigma factor (sigma-70 family)
LNSASQVPEKMTDDEIVRLVVSGKHEVFSVLYDRYSTKVFHKCISFVKERDTAKDLTHDIFIKTFLNLSKFSFQSKFGTWLYSITYNYCVDFVKAQKKIKKENDDNLADIADDEDSRNEEELLKIESARLMQVMDMMHPADKAILLMKYQDDLSIKDIQEILGLTESAVKMRIMRARAKALETYKSKYPDER